MDNTVSRYNKNRAMTHDTTRHDTTRHGDYVLAPLLLLCERRVFLPLLRCITCQSSPVCLPTTCRLNEWSVEKSLSGTSPSFHILQQTSQTNSSRVTLARFITQWSLQWRPSVSSRKLPAQPGQMTYGTSAGSVRVFLVLGSSVGFALAVALGWATSLTSSSSSSLPRLAPCLERQSWTS